MNRLLPLALLATSLPAMVQAQTAHTHSASCNHQWSDNQGALTFESASLAASQQARSNAIAPGMTFILNDLGGVGIGSQARAGFDAAAAMWSKVLKDPIAIQLDVRFSTLGPGILGSTGSTTNVINYTGLAGLLATDAKSVWDASSVASLQAGPLTFVSNEPPVTGPIDARLRFLDIDNSFDNNNIQINTAQVKALGLAPVYAANNPGGRDGSVSFSDQFVWDFDPSDGITAGAFDFVGVAAHEIGHALGFRSGVDLADANALPNRAGPNGARGLNGLAWGTVHDLNRFGDFAGTSTLDLSIGGASCFSINGGQNCLTLLSTGRFNGDGRQASHWKDDTLLNIFPPIGIMDPTASGPNGSRPFMSVSKFDLIAFDTMGYDLAVPEPASWAMMITGFGLVGGALRRRRDNTAAAQA